LLVSGFFLNFSIISELFFEIPEKLITLGANNGSTMIFTLSEFP
jgi:hypothetical protein